MKKLVLLLTLLLPFTFLQAQELHKTDAVVTQYPKTFTEAKELANLINTDFDTEEDKARAIYSWIAMNVKYDLKTHFSKKKTKRKNYKDKVDKAQKERKQRIRMENKALSEHLALAEGYATLYKTLCDLCGVYGYKIKGTAKLKSYDISKQPRIQNHTWNVIQIDKEWFFVDAMLGAGTVDYFKKTYQHNYNDKFFFMPPEAFFLNHFPKDQDWLLVEKTADDFAKLPLFSSEYFKNELKLIAPYEGLLDLKGQDSITFRIKSPVPLENLSYQFTYEKEPSEISSKKEKDTYTFDIPFLVKRRGYLNLFYKKKPLVSYKIGNY